MGNAESTEGGIKAVDGLQVGSMLPNSPAACAGLVPFFDMIVKVGEHELTESNTGTFKEYLKQHKGRGLPVTVYNSKVQALREATLVPNDDWGGVGLLGASLEWGSTVVSWHVTGVEATSPLATHLKADDDYIVGLEKVPGDPLHPVVSLLCDADDFHARISLKTELRAEGRTSDKLLFLVYRLSDNSVREEYANLLRSDKMGIDVSSGYIHNIPPGDALPSVKGLVDFRRGSAQQAPTDAAAAAAAAAAATAAAKAAAAESAAAAAAAATAAAPTPAAAP
eukprot:Rhum_TRINITY_DN14630_c22_g1::Rhum_TRINITY_DN14630_c22_g1_i1::g.105437::m.105437